MVANHSWAASLSELCRDGTRKPCRSWVQEVGRSTPEVEVAATRHSCIESSTPRSARSHRSKTGSVGVAPALGTLFRGRKSSKSPTWVKLALAICAHSFL